MDKSLKKIYDSEKSNTKCCDCQSETQDPWASLSHAIFVCINCSGIHRGFGPHISFVRSTSLGKFLFNLFFESFCF